MCRYLSNIEPIIAKLSLDVVTKFQTLDENRWSQAPWAITHYNNCVVESAAKKPRVFPVKQIHTAVMQLYMYIEVVYHKSLATMSVIYYII